MKGYWKFETRLASNQLVIPAQAGTQWDPRIRGGDLDSPLSNFDFLVSNFGGNHAKR